MPASLQPLPQAVPQSAQVRERALQASWRRGRWVAQRRLLGRWLFWAVGRAALPSMVIALLAGAFYAFVNRPTPADIALRTPNLSAVAATAPVRAPVLATVDAPVTEAAPRVARVQLDLQQPSPLLPLRPSMSADATPPPSAVKPPALRMDWSNRLP